MAKPASGTALDTGHALYTNLAAVWGLLEGSGASSADSKGTNTLTVNTSWGTDTAGDVCLAPASQITHPAQLTSTVTINGSASWSIAFRAKQTSSGTAGIVLGGIPNGDFLFFNGGNNFRFRNNATTDADFTGVTSFTTEADYLVTFDQPNGKVHLYVNGTEVNAGGLAATGSLDITDLGSAFAGGTFGLIGTLSYVYVWTSRLLTSTDAGTLASTPYVIFSSGGGGSNWGRFILSDTFNRLVQS